MAKARTASSSPLSKFLVFVLCLRFPALAWEFFPPRPGTISSLLFHPGLYQRRQHFQLPDLWLVSSSQTLAFYRAHLISAAGVCSKDASAYRGRRLCLRLPRWHSPYPQLHLPQEKSTQGISHVLKPLPPQRHATLLTT